MNPSSALILIEATMNAINTYTFNMIYTDTLKTLIFSWYIKSISFNEYNLLSVLWITQAVEIRRQKKNYQIWTLEVFYYVCEYPCYRIVLLPVIFWCNLLKFTIFTCTLMYKIFWCTLLKCTTFWCALLKLTTFCCTEVYPCDRIFLYSTEVCNILVHPTEVYNI